MSIECRYRGANKRAIRPLLIGRCIQPAPHLMASHLKHRVWVISRAFIGIFISLFVFRLIYGYSLPDSVEVGDYGNDFFSNVDLRKNYASEKGYSKAADGGFQGPSASSQKYEKTATTRSRSAAFEHDQSRFQERIKAYKGVVQYEHREGNPGDREVHLLIGVAPEQFDSFYTAVQAIGRIRSTQITKVDKTNEYRQLNAQKISLEKTLISLNELKTKSGDIDEYIALHEKIRSIESELQGLGVELGNFDTENEFCSVRFSLIEGAAEYKVSLVQRLKSAIEWTLQYFALAIVCIVGAALSALIIALLVDRLRRMMGSGTA